MLFHEMTREAINAIAPRAIALLPVGATEQHGPHLPTGTDTFAIEHIAHAAVARLGGSVPIVVTPALPFGSSAHHLSFGGTLSIGTKTYYHLIRDLCESLIHDHFARVFILNGHGGNHELIQLVVRDLVLEHPVSLAACSYWTAAWDELAAAGVQGEERMPGHAGAFESSMVLALRPELVREPRPSRQPDPAVNTRRGGTPVRVEHHDAWLAIDGYTDSPARGDAARGRLALDTAAAAIARHLEAFWLSTGGTR